MSQNEKLGMDIKVKSFIILNNINNKTGRLVNRVWNCKPKGESFKAQPVAANILRVNWY